MATIAFYQKQIQDAKAADVTLAGLISTSKTADWLLWTWVCATAMWILDGLFAGHKKEVAASIATQKPHTPKWYETKAKAFQYGDSLALEKDYYDPIDATHLIVANAAVVELVGSVRIKTAKLTGGTLAPLAAGELTAFTAYMGRIKDAGVRLQCTSGAPDDLRLSLGVFYDPLVIAADGSRIDGSSATPVQDAVNAFLKDLPFNGLFVLNYLIAALQAVEGVRIGEVVYCAARYGVLPYAPIAYEYNPDAGYLKLDSAYFIANTTYTAHGPI